MPAYLLSLFFLLLPSLASAAGLADLIVGSWQNDQNSNRPYFLRFEPDAYFRNGEKICKVNYTEMDGKLLVNLERTKWLVEFDGEDAMRLTIRPFTARKETFSYQRVSREEEEAGVMALRNR